jgi:hypothetical protein
MHEVPFNPNRTLYVRKPFKTNGRHYEAGQEFDWRRRGVTIRRVRQMYEQRWIVHDDSVTFPDLQTEPAPAQQPAFDSQEAGFSEAEPNEGQDGEADDLDSVQTLKGLQQIADAEGVSRTRSIAYQRYLIRQHRGSL